MSPELPVPEGFIVVRGPEATLVAARDRRAELARAGLAEPRRWGMAPAAGRRAGRGATSRLRLDGGTVLRIKQMRRGGWLGRVWRERFAGTRRLLDNLRIPREAARRGIPTPAPCALLLIEGPPRLFRAWLALEEVEGGEDLIQRLRATDPPTRDELRTVATLVRRMHDQGLEHRDLNLGNLLLRRRREGPSEPYVVDLDKARLHDRPLPFHLRQRAIRRLERSSLKLFGRSPVAGLDLRSFWYEAYAAGDAPLARRLERARKWNRLWLLVHRLGWVRRAPRRVS